MNTHTKKVIKIEKNKKNKKIFIYIYVYELTNKQLNGQR